MKVIKKGKPVKGWSAEVFCTGIGNGYGGCNAKLLVEHADLYLTHRFSRDDHEVFTTFRCPCCSVESDLTAYRGPQVTKERPSVDYDDGGR